MDDLSGRLAALIRESDLIQGKFIAESLARLPQPEREEFERYLRFCLANGESIPSLADAYLGMVDGIMGEQLYFARNGRYRYSRLDEVESHVYADPEYMGRYVRGIAISLYLWPQHQEIKRFFQDALPAKMAGAYLEVGPGHGMFFLHALRGGGFNRYLGIDISPTSLAATRTLLDSGVFGNFSGYELILADFLSVEPPQPVAACVAGEVLEHVERPELFLRKFRRCAAPGGFIFISTCVNAPVIDHIHNFNGVEGLEALFSSAGLDIDKRLLVPHAGRSVEQAAAMRLPISMAYVLRKA